MTRTTYPRFSTTAAHEPIIAWTETAYTYCTCTADECGQAHQGCDQEDDRFAWWVNERKAATYNPTALLESVAYDLHETDETKPWAYGEGTVMDLATGDELDITVFLARFAKPVF